MALSDVEINERVYGEPYHLVIEKLKEIKNHENPLKKIHIIEEARELISVCIDNFWMGINVPKDKLMIDAD